MTNTSAERKKVTLGVNKVIGTGDPIDEIMLIPLISDWKVPRECIWNMTGETCDKGLTRIYVLDEPFQGHDCVGACEEHHKALGGT